MELFDNDFAGYIFTSVIHLDRDIALYVELLKLKMGNRMRRLDDDGVFF